MGSPEDKVKFLDVDFETPPPTTVAEENEEDSSFCQLMCVSLVILVVFGVLFALVVFPSPRHDSCNERGYKAHFHKMKPGEDFEDFGEMYDSRMEEKRRHMKMFPEFRSWSKPTYPMRHTHSNPTRQTHTNPTHQIHNNPTDQTQPRNTYSPPPRSEKAKTARYIVHISDWGSISTISASMDGAPFGMAASFSDGTVANSTGVPYFYLASVV